MIFNRRPFLFLFGCLGACATIYTDTEQPINIVTTCMADTKVINSSCDLFYGGIRRIINTPSSIQIPRNVEKIQIACSISNISTPPITIRSSENWKWAGNVNPIVGFGVVGVVVDVASGSASQLPSFVNLQINCK
jgi:hypothetical protein